MTDSNLTLSAIETAVYDTLVARDAALTLADLAVEPRTRNYMARHLEQAVGRLAQDGIVWVEGNLVGIVEPDTDPDGEGNADTLSPYGFSVQ